MDYKILAFCPNCERQWITDYDDSADPPWIKPERWPRIAVAECWRCTDELTVPAFVRTGRLWTSRQFIWHPRKRKYYGDVVDDMAEQALRNIERNIERSADVAMRDIKKMCAAAKRRMKKRLAA